MPGKPRSSKPPVRVVVADDHGLFRDALRILLERTGEFQVIGEAVDGRQTAEVVERLQPDVVLLDLLMPDCSGLDALRDLAERPHRAHIVLVTATIDREEIAAALQLGARGIVMKEAASGALIEAIRTVMSGGLWVGDTAVPQMAAAPVPAPARPRSSQAGRGDFGLTPREREILTAITEGMSNKDIAERLSLSEQTVKHHLSSIFDKTGMSSRLELAMFAVRHGLT